MNSGSLWSDAFIDQISEKEVRDTFVADQVRAWIAQLIRVLREQEDRCWSQSELAERAKKTQSVISRLENPDGPQPSVQTLLEICSAFDLPLWIDFPSWDDWLLNIKDFPDSKTRRPSFSAGSLKTKAALAKVCPKGSVNTRSVSRGITYIDQSPKTSGSPNGNGTQLQLVACQ